MRISGLVPDRVFAPQLARERENWVADKLDINATVVSVEDGPDYLESAQDQVLASPAVLKLGVTQYAQGADALVLLCMSDPAVDALREAVQIPVVGAAEASILMTAALSTTAVIVTILPSAVGPIGQRVRSTPGGSDLVAGIGDIGMRIAAMRGKEDLVADKVEKVAGQLLKKTGAGALILGCTEMGVGVADELTDRLGVPVVDPNIAAYTVAASLLRAGLARPRRGDTDKETRA